MTVQPTGLIRDQIAYYRARADEYDEWWQRSNRYDHGAEATQRWWDEVVQVEHRLEAAGLAGDVLELACGTGWWTERLARSADRLTCIDAAPEVIAINRARIEAEGLPIPAYETADLFAWQPSKRFDAVFFSFWLSHVPEALFDRFWSTVATALKPGGRVVFIDSARVSASAVPAAVPDGIQRRELNDGRSFDIVKMFYKPQELRDKLLGLGWRCEVGGTDNYFIYGVGHYQGA